MAHTSVTMDISEYENLQSIIKEQKKVISEFEKESRVVLVDNTFNSVFSHPEFSCGHIKIPMVIGDELLAKEYMANKFKNLESAYIELDNKIKEGIASGKLKEIEKLVTSETMRKVTRKWWQNL